MINKCNNVIRNHLNLTCWFMEKQEILFLVMCKHNWRSVIMKRILAVLLAMVIAVSMTVYVNAAYFTETEDNNSMANANSVDVDCYYNGTIGKPGDVDYFIFKSRCFDKIYIRLTSYQNNVRYLLSIRDSNNNVLQTGDNSGSQSCITYNCAAGTTYYIVVSGATSSDYYAGGISYTLDLVSKNYLYMSPSSSTGKLLVNVDQSIYNYGLDQHLSIALNSWRDATASIVDITTTNSSQSTQNTIYAGDYDDTWYGMCLSYSNSSGGLSRFTIQINNRSLTNAPKMISKFNYFLSTITHEFGHPLGLADNPTTNSESLMKHSRDRNVVYTPMFFDILAIYEKYPRLYTTNESQALHGETNTNGVETCQIYTDYMVYGNSSDLYDIADLIIVCEPTNSYQGSELVGNENLAYTFTDVTVKSVIKGDSDISNITVKQLGGFMNGCKYLNDDVEYLSCGNEYLLFLEVYEDGTASLINPVQGMYYYNNNSVVARNSPNALDISNLLL